MSGALTYREGQPVDSDPVETFFDVVCFLMGFLLEEIELDIVNDSAYWRPCIPD